MVIGFCSIGRRRETRAPGRMSAHDHSTDCPEDRGLLFCFLDSFVFDVHVFLAAPCVDCVEPPITALIWSDRPIGDTVGGNPRPTLCCQKHRTVKEARTASMMRTYHMDVILNRQVWCIESMQKLLTLGPSSCRPWKDRNLYRESR